MIKFESIEDRADYLLELVKNGCIKKHISKNSSNQTHKEIEKEERIQYDFFVRTKFYNRLMSMQRIKI